VHAEGLGFGFGVLVHLEELAVHVGRVHLHHLGQRPLWGGIDGPLLDGEAFSVWSVAVLVEGLGCRVEG